MKYQCFVTALLILLSGCDVPMKTPEQISADKIAEVEYEAENVKLDPFRKKIKDYLLSKEEPSIKDVYWSANNNLKVGRYYKGTNQNGFAEYLCLIVKDIGWNTSKIYIDIVDIEKVLTENEFVTIGQATCDNEDINKTPTFVDFTKK